MDKRNRTIRWPVSVDEAAERLAAERGCQRGVSELLEQLVWEESRSPRLPLAEPSPGYKAHIRQSQKLGHTVLKKARRKGR